MIREAEFARRTIALWSVIAADDGPKDVYDQCYKAQLAALAGS
ncbi:MAG TPA: hypothetical protein VH143_09085 [Kofleriaceae bacterium]|nr:hypothetical protein [Kofleriaceae bacterium]